MVIQMDVESDSILEMLQRFFYLVYEGKIIGQKPLEEARLT